VCQVRDLWLLAAIGLLRNALDPRAFVLLMEGEVAAMVFTDPPYNVRIEGHVSGLGAIHQSRIAMASGEMDPLSLEIFASEPFCCSLVTVSTRHPL